MANIFHAICVILKMSVYSLVIARECGGNRDAHSQNKIKFPWKVLVWRAPVDTVIHGM